MTEDVRKELEDLKTIIVAWKESYLKLAREDGGGEYMIEEYNSEIEELVFPYVYKIIKLGGMEMEDFMVFSRFCYKQVLELREALIEMGAILLEKEECDAREI